LLIQELENADKKEAKNIIKKFTNSLITDVYEVELDNETIQIFKEINQS